MVHMHIITWEANMNLCLCMVGVRCVWVIGDHFNHVCECVYVCVCARGINEANCLCEPTITQRMEDRSDFIYFQVV